MELQDPIPVYIADGNLEAHTLVELLQSNGIAAYAVEDNSGASLFEFGTLSQFHRPQVFAGRRDAERAKELITEFEAQRLTRRKARDDVGNILSMCEECGELSEFSASQSGSVQNCPKCQAFMDVGPLDWPGETDFGEENDDT